ncbi:hypothetical protein scyTo_0010731 [Scyliorhinus torazame]|uniref:CR-type domain-containing protein n=1 Tax=Scyliorhinus torazame TaxID=75743 RepID=A0A401PAV4_SCYTO|nr:hypothetical protein [Scyliorhinus torazame]
MEKQALLSATGSPGYDDSINPAPIPASSVAAFPEVPQDEEWASAPPAEMLDDVAGYEGTIAGGEGNFVLPPISITEGTRRDEPRPQREWRLISLQYRLESFTESRSTEWKMVPFKGQFVDSSAYGMAPLPWNIIVPMPPMFQDNVSKVPVPHTSSTKGCHSCMTLGKIACTKCTATGMVKCWVCKGRGYQFNDNRCTHCNGTGLQRCDNCSGHGTRACQTCRGSGQLMLFIQLTVKWKNNIFEGIADRESGLPLGLYSKINGQNIFTEQQSRVNPIVSFPDSQINRASQTAIQEHAAQLARTSPIIQQRQTIEFIPITQVHYEWKEKEYSYFTCGTENRVYSPDYPAKCCCCSIL